MVIVSAVMTGSGTNKFGGNKLISSELIENAMVRAVQAAQEEGITDPEVIREMILAARQKVFDDAAKVLADMEKQNKE